MRCLRFFSLLILLLTFGCQGATLMPTVTPFVEVSLVTPSPVTPTSTILPPTFPPSDIDITPTVITGNIYYVSPNGTDANSGMAEEQAWRTLENVNRTAFQPGDVVRFERGGSWSGGLTIKNSGEMGRPIIYTSYGSGTLPVINNPGVETNYTSAIRISGQWVMVDGIKVNDAQDAGIFVQANNVIIKNVEATNVGIGIKLNGSYNLVTRNYIHDLHMVKNTVGGTDDYGAIGIAFSNASYNEVSYNRIANCVAASYDFGTDGGVMEFYGRADGNYIHHNWGSDSNGFIEVGGGSAVDDVLAYNVSVNNGGFTSIHLNDAWASTVNNFRAENNTIVEVGAADWMLVKFVGDPTAETFVMRNNIIYVNGFQGVSNKTGFTHLNNLYYLTGGTQMGFELARGEQNIDPLFMDISKRDFRLQAGSVAIDAGLDLGYLLDFVNLPVPYGFAPDLGAFEFQPQ